MSMMRLFSSVKLPCCHLKNVHTYRVTHGLVFNKRQYLSRNAESSFRTSHACRSFTVMAAEVEGIRIIGYVSAKMDFWTIHSMHSSSQPPELSFDRNIM